MTAEEIKRICVLGAGTMGRQIALCASLGGYEVFCVDTSETALEKARGFVDDYLRGRVERGKITGEVARAGQENLSFTGDLEEAAVNADLVIESVPEELALKRQVFSRLDKLCPKHALLVTNSSFIVTSRLAGATGRPDKICNMHFFTPPLVMKPVEVVKGPETTSSTVDVIAGVCKSMGKIPILLEKEIHGFLVNRILDATHKEALFLYEMGIASYEDIDTAVVEGLGHKTAPFWQMDLIGLDLILQISREHYRETGDPGMKPSPTIVKMVAGNLLGRKSGRGFYDYGEMLKKRAFL